MTPRQRRRLERAIERELLGELAPRQSARLRARLRAEAPARAAYDRTVTALRILEGREVAATELDLVARRLFADRARDAATAPAAGLRRPLWALVAAAVALAAVVALLVTSPGPERPRADEYIAARSGAGSASGLAITALCGPADERGELHPAASAACPWSGRLSFAYAVSEAVAPGSLLTLFAVDDHGRVSYYAPTPDGVTSIVTTAGRWQALPISVALAVNHVPGRWQLHALTTTTPVTPAEVREAAQLLASTPADPDAGPTPSWLERLAGRGQLARRCAAAPTCHTAELSFWIEEDTP